MKIDLDKPAFAAPHSIYNDGSMNADPQEGMTVREELWARFAAAAEQAMLRNAYSEQADGYHKEIAHSAIEMANAMIAAIEAREE